jgi:hypothetical protein
VELTKEIVGHPKLEQWFYPCALFPTYAGQGLTVWVSSTQGENPVTQTVLADCISSPPRVLRMEQTGTAVKAGDAKRLVCVPGSRTPSKIPTLFGEKQDASDAATTAREKMTAACTAWTEVQRDTAWFIAREFSLTASFVGQVLWLNLRSLPSLRTDTLARLLRDPLYWGDAEITKEEEVDATAAEVLEMDEALLREVSNLAQSADVSNVLASNQGNAVDGVEASSSSFAVEDEDAGPLFPSEALVQDSPTNGEAEESNALLHVEEVPLVVPSVATSGAGAASSSQAAAGAASSSTSGVGAASRAHRLQQARRQPLH